MVDHHATTNRRSYLKAAAGIAGLTALGVGSASAAGEDYNVVEVPAGETYRVSLSDGETFENTLIDISAKGAEYRITALSNNWEIRNIGVRGTWDDDYKVQPIVVSVENENATGIIDNVYLGNPVNDSLGGVTGIYVMRSHAGELQVNCANIQNFGDNGLYSSSPGHAASDANGGDTIVTNSYASNNLVTGFRLGTSGSYLKNCVAYDNEHRGLWAYYEHTQIIDCDIGKNPTDVYVGISADYYEKGTRAEVTATDSNFDEVYLNTSTNDIHGKSAGTPQDRIPEGCPTSPEEAASGGGYSASVETGGNNDTQELSDDAHLVAFVTEEGSSRAMYDFTAEAPIEFTEAPYESPSGNAIEGGTWSSVDYIDQTDEQWEAGGGTGGGYGDAFLVDGPVSSVELDSDTMWIELNGEKVSPEELIERTAPEESESQNDLVAFITGADSSRAMYDFTADGPVEFTEAPYESPSGNTIEGGTWSSVDYIEQTDEQWEAGGGTGGGYGDAFLVSGSITSVNLKSDTAWIELNGEEVTPEELIEQTASEESTDQTDSTEEEQSDTNADLANTIVVDGTQTNQVSVYEFSVSGEIEAAADLTSTVDGGLSWDSLEDNVSGDTVTGVIGMGKDGYRFSGEITNKEVQGDASVTVEKNE